MSKKTRKAVRTYLIKDNKAVVIKYKQHDEGFYGRGKEAWTFLQRKPSF